AGGSVDYLLSYPYGCVEQTTSALIPWLAIGSLRDSIPSLAKYPPEKVRDATQKGVERLLPMQLPQGGFTSWPGATEEAEWATSYAGLALILASKSGTDVPAAAISSLCDRLDRGLRGISETTRTDRLEEACQALWILAIADRHPDAYVNGLRERMDELPPRARCFLALAADACNSAGDPVAILRNKTPFKGQTDSWMTWNNDRALKLLAWATVSPDSPEAAGALESLLKERNPYGHWRTTWANGWAMIAMAA